MDNLKAKVAAILGRIQHGQVPDEVAELYRNLGRSNFSYWCHGALFALSKDKTVRDSELYKFLRKEILEV